MIDWAGVAANSLWLTGLALMLATLSFWDWSRKTSRLPARGTWRTAAGSFPMRLGSLLFCAGMGLTAGSWLEIGLWALLWLNILYEWWRAWRRGDVAPRAGLPGARGVSNGASRPARFRSIGTAVEWIVRTELLWLALLSPFFLFPAPSRVVPLLGLPLLWIARRIARGRFVPPTPLDWPIALLMLMVLVSIYATFDLSFSLGKITGVLFGIGVYYALVEWAASGKRLHLAAGGYALAGGALAVVGLLSSTWSNKLPILSQLGAQIPGLLRGLPGAEGGVNPNEVGGSLLWVVPLQLSLLGCSWSPRSAGPAARWLLRFGLTLLVALSAGTLLLTQSRSALIGFALGIALLVWLAGRKARLALATILVVGMAATLYAGPQNVADRVLGASGPALDPASNIQSLQGRAEIWSRAIYGIEDFPFTGMGMNNFRRVMPILYPLFSVSPEADLAHAHNHLLQAALDLGLPGLVAYLAIWMLAAALLAITWRSTPDLWTRAAAAGLGAGLLGHFVFGLTDAVALGAKPGVFFWALLGLAVALWRQSSSRSSEALPTEEKVELVDEGRPALAGAAIP